MKKSDDKLFNPEFVHFMWDDSLEGKMGFVDDGIGSLVVKVNNGEMDTIHKSGSTDYPFKRGEHDAVHWRFAYYDPHYEYKRAWLGGKRVQYMTTIYVKNKWEDVPDEWNWDVMRSTQYRIAPEKTWRPFKDVGELRKAWSIKETSRTDIVLAYELTEPMIWIRSKANSGCTRMLTGFDDFLHTSSGVWVGGSFISLEQLFDDYTFLDGTPCGVEVEVEE